MEKCEVCETCKHWDPPVKQEGRYVTPANTHGRCTGIGETQFDFGPIYENPAVVQGPEGGWLRTEGHFGCTLHELKKLL